MDDARIAASLELHFGDKTNEEASHCYCALVALARPCHHLAPTSGRAAPIPTLRSMAAPIITGPALYRRPCRGAFSRNNTFHGLTTGNNGNNGPVPRRCGGADYQFAPNWVAASKSSISGLSGSVPAPYSPAASPTTTTSALLARSPPVGYTWGPGSCTSRGVYAFPTTREREAWRRSGPSLSRRHRNGFTVGTGLEYILAPNWFGQSAYQYYNFRQPPTSPHRPRWFVLHLHHRRPSREAAVNYSHQLGAALWSEGN